MFAIVPVALRFPDEMAADIAEVLSGEYEAGYDGQGLTILDIGANVGAFTIWANLRWPNSAIHAYEPNPETFRMLLDNVGHLRNVSCHEQAVYPEGPSRQLLYSQYAGDGESGLTAYIGETFADPPVDRLVPVTVERPSQLPACDVLKIDVEGGEAEILQAMDLEQVSLILLEYQNMANRRAIERRLRTGFSCEFVDCFPWDPILPNTTYRRELAGDSYGHMFFVNSRATPVRKTSRGKAGAFTNWPVDPGTLSVRRLLAELRGAARRAVMSRLSPFR